MKAIYQVVRGVLQTVTGPLSDRWGRKGLIVAVMWVQAIGLLLMALTQSFAWRFGASVLLGLGTTMVYPTLIASVSDASHPSWRARSLSVYRFWGRGRRRHGRAQEPRTPIRWLMVSIR